MEGQGIADMNADPSKLVFCQPTHALYRVQQVGAVVQKVCAHVLGLPKAAEVSESPLDKMFGGGSDKGKSLVALKEEAADRRRILQRAAQEAGMFVRRNTIKESSYDRGQGGGYLITREKIYI